MRSDITMLDFSWRINAVTQDHVDAARARYESWCRGLGSSYNNLLTVEQFCADTIFDIENCNDVACQALPAPNTAPPVCCGHCESLTRSYCNSTDTNIDNCENCELKAQCAFVPTVNNTLGMACKEKDCSAATMMWPSTSLALGAAVGVVAVLCAWMP
jgi:hypothetical protein